MKMKRVIAMAMALALIISFSAYGSEVDPMEYEDCKIVLHNGDQTIEIYGLVSIAEDGTPYISLDLPVPDYNADIFDGWYTKSGIKVTEDYKITERKVLDLYAFYRCGDGVIFTFDKELGQLTITGKGTMDSLKNAKSYPWYQFKASITSLVVEEGVTELGAHAFEGYSGIKKINIPANTLIGKNALKKVSLN